MESEILIPDLIQYILSLIPLKPRTRLKLVSKDWRDMIIKIRECALQTSTSHGLVYTRYGDTNFIALRDHGKEGILLDSLKLNSPEHTLIGSCNGLLLYADVDLSRFVVYSPVLKQGVAVSMTRYNRDLLNCYIDFFFDKHFKIICFGVVDHCRKFAIQVFSSETWEWYAHQVTLLADVDDYDIPIFDSNKILSCRSDGKIYFLYGNSLTVYDIEKNSFENTIRLGWGTDKFDFVWESQGKIWGCYSFSYSFKNNRRVGIFVLQDDRTWKRTDIICKGQVMDKLPHILSDYDDLKPVSFNEDMQTLYFQFRHVILAYSLEIKLFTIVCFDPSLHQSFSKEHTTFSFLFKPVDISHFKSHLLKIDEIFFFQLNR